MRIFEILLFIGLFCSAAGIVFLKNVKFIIIATAPPVIFSAISILAEGARFVMIPAYVLSIILFAIGLVKSFLKLKKRYPILKAFGAVGICFIYAISIVLANFVPVVNLPKPAGSSIVGTIRLDFTQTDRRDILTNKTSLQKIAVQVWYPASGGSTGKKARWLDSRKAASYFATSQKLPDIFGQLCLAETNSYWNASLSNKMKKYPVVLFSGGAGMFNGQNTIQMEELASRGYVVFAVSHPYDDFAVIYSNGDIVPYSQELSSAISKDAIKGIDIAKKQVKNQNSPDFQRAAIENCRLSIEDARLWSQDMSFVADEVEKLNDGSIKSIFKGKLDVNNMGIFGHSFGGAAAGETCLRDSRFKAFINLDGTPFGDSTDNIIKQPFMVLCSGTDSKLKFSAAEGYSKNQKNFLVIKINGAQHMNFSDLNTIIPNIGRKIGVLGTISADRQEKIINTYIVSFFNKYLKGEYEPMLNQYASKYPEVKIERK